MNTDYRQNRVADAQKFLDTLFGSVKGTRYGYLWTKHDDDHRIYHFAVTDAAARAEMARRAIELNDDGFDVYVGVNLGDAPPAKGKRYTKEQITVQTATVTDIDCEGGNHISDDKKTYPPNFDAAKKFLPFSTSMVVDSGYGLHAYCVYAEPILISGENRATAEERNKKFIQVIRSRAGVFSGAVDGVGDLPRVLRLPGTFNYKGGTENAPLCHVVEYRDDRFTPADMDAQLKSLLPPPPVSKPPTRPARQPSFSTDKPTDEERARAMIKFVPLKDLSENEWLSAMSALKNLGFSYDEVDALNQGGAHYNERENRARWESLKDPSFDIATLHGIAQHYGYSEHDFLRDWYKARRLQAPVDRPTDFDSEQGASAEKIIRTRDQIKNCPVNLKVPCNFLFDYHGITYLEPSRKEDEKPRPKTVSLTPIIPTKKFREPVNGNVAYEFAIFTDDTWCTTEFEGATLADTRELTKVLATKGALILDAKLVGRFFAEIIKFNSHDLPKIKSRNQTGWTTDDCEEFAFPAEDSGYVVRRAGYDFDKVFKPKGDAGAWKDKFLEVMAQGGAAARVAMGIAAASFLVRPLGLINLQGHIWGQRSIGKTPLLKFCVSAFGDPNLNALSYSFGATSPKSRLELHCAYRDLPLIGEEIESLSDKERDNLPRDIYNFSLGIGGQVLKNDGTLRDAKIFSGARLSSGENDICNATGNGGELKRVLSLRCPTLLPEQFAADLHGFCKRHHGHFLQAWTQYIIKNKDFIAEKYHRGLKYAQQRFTQVDPTQLQTLIAATVAYQLFKQALKLSDLANDADAINAEMNADIAAVVAALPTATDIDDTSRAIDFLKSFVAGHVKFFDRDVKNGNGVISPINAYAFESYGKIFADGEVAFLPHALKKILEGEGGFKSSDKLIAEFYDRGLLRTNKGERTFKTYIGHDRPRTYCFKRGVFDIAIEDTPADGYADTLSKL